MKNSIIILLTANIFTIYNLIDLKTDINILLKWKIIIIFFLLFLVIAIMIKPKINKKSTQLKRIQKMENGCCLLRNFFVSSTVSTLFQFFAAVWFVGSFLETGTEKAFVISIWIGGVLWAVIIEAIVFWCGMIRIYITSVQLGIKHRILSIIFAWIPFFNIYYLLNMIKIVSEEIEVEMEKNELNVVRKEGKICETKYPLLFVHGVFFRDHKYINYWGRIPGELIKNGAKIFFGNQQSAASVEDSGKELAQRIMEIVKETGSEKVNIIAHSKGGLDARAAISHYGADAYVASLTTISTPHRGCMFADYLLTKIPEKTCLLMSKTYNETLKKMGDSSPDFMAAVRDLSNERCIKQNETMPDVPGVLYESVMSYCKKARSGKFPLNMSYSFVKHFDGKNDGLVSLESAQWGSNFTVIKPSGKRGISHGDIIDLNRENIPGFDVREFYVSIVAKLKERGY